jgi:uncharacterized phage protein gp47/JayE
MSTVYGITSSGFVLKRLSDIISDMNARLAQVQDPVTLETLNLTDENDPLMQFRDALADQVAVCWEQLQMAYNQFIPTQASGRCLDGLVQINGLLRQINETDTNLRLRQQTETAGTGYVQIDAIYAAVAALPGVQFCRACQNSTLVNPDDRGIPAKSLAVVVVGGNTQQVADAIFAKAGADVGYYGNTTATCHDTQGLPYTVKYVTPTPVPITIVVNLTITDYSLWPQDGIARVKQAIVDYAAYGEQPNIGLFPGADVVPSRLYTPVNTVSGHEIDHVWVARDSATPAPSPTAIAWNEVAEITTDNITVNL